VEVVSKTRCSTPERILRQLRPRAFRRTVTKNDVAPYVDIVKAKLAGNYSFEQAMRAALKGVLMSPEFLFLREKPASSTTSPWPAACRYFLWSTSG